ncbi:MAG: hypothetical protein AABX79_02805 [Nanoarchaeota archaeon]
MYGKSGLILPLFFLLIVSLGIVYAQTDILSEIESEYPNAELETEAGIGPDSFFYFFDSFFDRFGDDLKVREERVAEIREMIREGKTEEALDALRRYEAVADKLEAEIDPERRDEARKGAAAIRNAIDELESDIPEEFREEFLRILEREEAIVTAAEISSRIKELCETLSEIDPLEYSRVCKTGEDASDWQKKLDRKLTEEQRQEAIKFGEIMSECFKTSGQECRCEEIPFTEFAETCSIAAPLAVQCDIEGNETACEELDNLEMPELPPHLQDVFNKLEGDISEAQFDLHMPQECREAGATNPKECMKIMVQTRAPEECRDAILEADVQNEREAREICEKIMFELNAPEECIEANVRNPKECGKLMFQMNAPKECLDAGLTGENRGDEKKCRTIMESKGEGPRGFGPPALGIRCREIQNPEERLKCYDAALSGAEGSYVEHRGESSRGWPEQCQKEQAFTRESCERVMREWGEQQRQEFEQFQPGQEFVEPQTPQEFTEPSPTETPTEPSPTTSSGETTTSSSETTTSSVTGAVIDSNNDFFNYYFR